MIHKILLFLLFPTILLTALKSLETNNFLSLWILTETSSFSFSMMLALSSKNKKASTTYFLSQIFSSMIIFMLFFSSNLNWMNSSFNQLMISMAILLKLGIFPFHQWIPLMFKSTNWFMIFFASTFQKIPPLMFAHNFLIFNNILIFIIMISIFMSALISMKFFNLKLIMAYSSINHTSWMLLSLMQNYNLFIQYFCLYTLSNLILILIFHQLNLKNFINSMNLNMKKKLIMIMFFNLISYLGIPPLMGFSNKWIFIEMLSLNIESYIFIFIMFMSSFIFMYTFMRIIYPIFLYPSSKFKNLSLNNLNINPIISILFSLNWSFIIFFILII